MLNSKVLIYILVCIVVDIYYYIYIFFSITETAAAPFGCGVGIFAGGAAKVGRQRGSPGWRDVFYMYTILGFRVEPKP